MTPEIPKSEIVAIALRGIMASHCTEIVFYPVLGARTESDGFNGLWSELSDIQRHHWFSLASLIETTLNHHVQAKHNALLLAIKNRDYANKRLQTSSRNCQPLSRGAALVQTGRDCGFDQRDSGYSRSGVLAF